MNADIPEFDVSVGEDGRVSFVHAPQARAYLRRLRQAEGEHLVLQIYPHRAKRSDRQNRAFHACITPWAKERGWEIDTLKQFLAMAQRAVALVTPDSGPMHMANAMGTPVIGLHAASNPARSGPYSSRQWCVDRYDAAARRFRGKPAAALPWGSKLEYPGVMDLVETDAAIERLDALLASPQAGRALP